MYPTVIQNVQHHHNIDNTMVPLVLLDLQKVNVTLKHKFSTSDNGARHFDENLGWVLKVYGPTIIFEKFLDLK